jgi:hypothetical protein
MQMEGAQCGMATFIYKCPKTRRNVQAWFAEEVPANEGEPYETVKCLACKQVHLINRLTGKASGTDGE